MMHIIKYIPITGIIIATVTVIVTSYLTISQGHVTDSAPYISDTGTLPPESCIFGQALNFLWLLISYAMYIKYRQVSFLLNTHNMDEHELLNRCTLMVGLLAAFGSSIVANFQETNMFFIHWVGAVLVFGFGAIYQCMQTVLYFHLASLLGQKKLTKVRLVLSIISTTSFLLFLIFAIMAFSAKKVSDDYLHWKKLDGGYKFHNISVVSEWVCGSSTMMYLMLFSDEFKRIAVREPDIFTKHDNTHVEQIDPIT